MEELAKLEAERGNPEYLEAGPGEAGYGRGSLKGREAGRREGAVRGRRASNEMCNFLILNISSLQLIPVNMIAYRSQYGSADPTAVIAPAIAATLVSTLVAVVYCKIKDCVSADYISGNRINRSCTDKSRIDKKAVRHAGSVDLTASEARGISERARGFRQADTPDTLSDKRNGRGGRAV